MTPISSTEKNSPAIRFCGAKIAASSGAVECGDWEIAWGEAWFVAGGIATGKTSLLRAIAGLEQPVGGRIERFGADWAGVTEGQTLNERRRIGTVLSHDAGLFHRSTIQDNVRLPLYYHGVRSPDEIDQRVRGLLTALEIDKYAQVPSIRAGPTVARRTLLARSLALEPEVLLLDDPCAGLDGWERRRLLNFIARLHVGHDLNEARPMTLIITGASPADWREFPDLKWAILRAGQLSLARDWEQLVASAPELFHDPDFETVTG